VPVPVPVNTTSVAAAPTPTPTPTPAPAPAPAVNAPRVGGWDSSRGGYIVGQSGEIQIDTFAPHHASASENYQVQYRGSDGKWTHLGLANELHGTSVTVKDAPGTKLEFRINAYGDWQQAGTTLNSSGKDMGKVTRDGDGYKLGFENYKTGNDFEDLYLKFSDPKAPR